MLSISGISSELLSNGSFENWAIKPSTLPASLGEFCPGWQVEYPGASRGSSLSPGRGETKTGVVFRAAPGATWFRILQKFNLEAGPAPTVEFTGRVRTSQPGAAALLDWIAILTLDGTGKRVFKQRLLEGVKPRTGWADLNARATLSEVPNGGPCFLAFHLTGAGEVELDDISLALVSPDQSIELLEGLRETKKEASPPVISLVASGSGSVMARLSAESIKRGEVEGRRPAGEMSPAKRAAAEAAPPPQRNDEIKRALPLNGPEAAFPEKSGKKIAVVSWDMGHNPVGRAYLLAELASRQHDVTLLGPMSPTYGTEIWPPIANTPIRKEAFPAKDLRSLVEGALALASRTECDVVHVGKARLPSLLLGALIKHKNKCPMILDIDDHELSFFGEATPASLDELLATDPKSEAATTPHSELWTRFSETLAASADGITVSNVALQARFGGIIVRHARDERLFDPSLYQREEIRREFGYTPADRVILFLGTPRPHKGVFDICDALEELNDPRLALCVIGSINDKRVSSRFSGYKKARIGLHENQPWERLPALVSMADAVFILQDPKHPISGYQIPAKLTDSLAMGVPTYCTPVPPVADLISAGAMEPVADTAALKGALGKLAAQPAGEAAGGKRERGYYLAELSYSVNGARLELAYEASLRNRQADLGLLDETFAYVEQVTGLELPRFTKRPVRSRPVVLKPEKPARDLVFLWKQNDSDLYGRRPDMVAKYLLRSGRVGRILHLDAPIGSADLEKRVSHGPHSFADEGNLVYLNTVRRMLKLADTPRFTRRTFVYRSGPPGERAFGTDLPPKGAYPDFLRSTLKEFGLREDAILWCCPAVFDVDLVRTLVKPAITVSDLIDDQRKMPMRQQYLERVNGAYTAALSAADIVIANCEPVQRGFSELRSDINVIPNGAEMFDDVNAWDLPEELKGLPRPIFGYVGNLRDRFDVDLARKVADKYPHGSVVLVGSAHGRPDVVELGKRQNIHVLGVKPYDQAVKLIRNFDVALMPHVKNAISDNMNPLKLYVYFSLGVPIVTTAVENIGDLAPYVGVGSSHSEFLSRIDEALADANAPLLDEKRREILSGVSWQRRTEGILKLLDGKTLAS